MKQRQKLELKPKFNITGKMSKSEKTRQNRYVREFILNSTQKNLDYSYSLGYKKLSRLISKHFRNMNLEFVQVALPKESHTLPDNFMISQSPHSWSIRSPYNKVINCEFPEHYVEKLISFYKEFAKKVKRSRTLKIQPFEDIDIHDSPLLLAYEIFPFGKNDFIPRISLYIETYFIKIWIYAEQDPPAEFLYDPSRDLYFFADTESPEEGETQAENTIIQITFNSKKIGYHKGKSFKGRHKKNIDRTLTKNFSAPEDISEVARIYLDSWEFEQGKDGDLTLYYEIPSDKIWHLDITNILGLVDLTLKGS